MSVDQAELVEVVRHHGRVGRVHVPPDISVVGARVFTGGDT
jgi:hypothetical protein